MVVVHKLDSRWTFSELIEQTQISRSEPGNWEFSRGKSTHSSGIDLRVCWTSSLKQAETFENSHINLTVQAERLTSTTSRKCQLKQHWWRQPKLRPCRSPTVLDVVEDDEFLPAQLFHQRQHHVVETDGGSRRQRVALPAGARVELAGGARRALAIPLDEQVGDVHGVRQWLQSAGRGAARRRDQRQDALVHQLTGWGEGETEVKWCDRDAGEAPPSSPSWPLAHDLTRDRCANAKLKGNICLSQPGEPANYSVEPEFSWGRSRCTGSQNRTTFCF